ncbi:MAG: hypothetical protein ACKV0T_05640 [Planctomycetales bacterium]
MNPSQIIPALFDFVKSILRIAWVRHRVILDAMTVAAVGAVCWLFWRGASPDVVVYVGPPDSSSARAGLEVVSELRNTESPAGVRYRARVEYTNGFDDVRQRLQTSNDTIAIGFLSELESRQTDGEDQRRALSVLLPLDWDYLHVMCSVDFLRSIERRAGKVPKNLSEILGYLERPQRIFLGPPGSNSVKLAELILKQYDVSPTVHQALGINDWSGMRQGFRERKIDLAFYCGPLGSKTVFNVADDETAALVGVGPITKALRLTQNIAIAPANLPENLARAVVAPPAQDSSLPADHSGETTPETPIPFCRPDLETISVRRFLVCSSTLSTDDAYVMARAGRKALEQDYPIDLKLSDPPFVRDVQAPASQLRLHAGTALLRDQQSLTMWRDPTTWPSWLQLTALGVLVALGVEILRMLQRRLDELAGLASAEPAPGTAAAAPTPDKAYQGFKQRMEGLEAELEQQAFVESASKSADWMQRMRQLREEIRAATELSEPHRDSLLRDLALAVQFMSLRRETPPAKQRGRKTSAAESVEPATHKAAADPRDDEPTA